MVFGLFANSAGFRQLPTLYRAHHKKNAAAMPGGYIFLRFGVAFAYSLCVTKKPSSWEYIFQPPPFPSHLTKYTPTCFSVPLVGLDARFFLVRLHSVPADFLGVQSHIRRSMQHHSLRLYPCCWPPLRTLFGTRYKSTGSFSNRAK